MKLTLPLFVALAALVVSVVAVFSVNTASFGGVGDSNFTNVVASGDLTAGDDITAGDNVLFTSAAGCMQFAPTSTATYVKIVASTTAPTGENPFYAVYGTCN